MLITIEKQVTETVATTVAITLPAFFKHVYTNQKILITTEEHILLVLSSTIVFLPKDKSEHYKKRIVEALSPSFEPCTAEEFEATYNEAMNAIVGAYNTMLAF